MSQNPTYEFAYVTTSDDAVPEALQGSTYWYEIGEKTEGFDVVYDTSDTYAIWYYGLGAIYIITPVANYESKILPTDIFTTANLNTPFVGFGAWSGSIAISDSVISDAWYRAETTAFESLSAFLGCTEGKECFRGFLPVQGDFDDYKSVNVWQMSSGDSGAFEIDRIQGDNPNWCSLRSDVTITSLWTTRERAMKFAGAVIAWLKSTTNLNETGNVTWCTLADIPSEPTIYRTDGKKNRERYWEQVISLELVYKTGSEY